MLYLNPSKNTGGKTKKWDLSRRKIQFRSLLIYIFYRSEKEKINERIKEGEQKEEVDDSGFYAGGIIILIFRWYK